MLQRKCKDPAKAAQILFDSSMRRNVSPGYMRHLANDWLKSSFNSIGQALHKIIDEHAESSNGSTTTL